MRCCSSDKSIISLKKARTLLDKIIDMKSNGKYCIDIIQQNLAVIGLLKSVNLSLLEGHLYSCFVDAVKSDDKDKLDVMVKEILGIVKIAQNK